MKGGIDCTPPSAGARVIHARSVSNSLLEMVGWVVPSSEYRVVTSSARCNRLSFRRAVIWQIPNAINNSSELSNSLMRLRELSLHNTTLTLPMTMCRRREGPQHRR